MPHRKDVSINCPVCGESFLTSQYAIDVDHRKYCSHKCDGIGRIRPTLERFLPKVDKNGPVHPVLGTRCWLWTASKRHKLGYGGFWDGKRFGHAHRISYELFNGPIPEGEEVLHRCDNPNCVNPEHLIIGSHAENMANSKAKGRTIGGFYNMRIEKRPLGEKHGQAKLTDDDVREIRRKFEIEGAGVTELSRQYHMTHAQIGMIARRKAWTHVK